MEDLKSLGLSEQELFSRVDHNLLESERITAPRYSYWRSVFRVFFRRKINIVILCILGLVFLMAFVYPTVFGYDQFSNLNDATTKHLNPAEAFARFGPSIRWILGTGGSGASTWDAIWFGSRVSLTLAMICTVINMSIGILLGAVWGFSKKLDVIMIEIRNIIGNVPGTLLISVLVLIFSPSFWTLIFAMCITGWLGVASFIRTQVLIIRDREYNLASRCLGTSTFKIAIKNILPFMTSVIVTIMATEIPGYIGSEVFLSYIGLGISEMSLGKLITENQSAMFTPGWQFEFWSPIFVSSIITVVLFVVGQNLGDASDPRTHM